MNPLEIKLIVIALCAGCKLIGELWWHNAQRYIMPVIIGIAVSIISQVWWLGIVCLPMIAPIDLGYKFYGTSDSFARGMWLFTICLVAGLGITLLHHVSFLYFVPYCILGGAWGATTRNLSNIIIAPVSGILIGSLIFFVH